jgi:hypothetical protein
VDLTGMGSEVMEYFSEGPIMGFFEEWFEPWTPQKPNKLICC